MAPERWLVSQGYEVVCFLGNCGQEEDFDAVKAKALKLGAEKMVIENVQQELIDDLEARRGAEHPVSSTPKVPWSMDDNIIYISYEPGILEQTDMEPPKDMWKRTVDPLDTPDEPTRFTVHFTEGVPVKLEVRGKAVTGSLEIFKEANELGRANGIGREDIVESRFIGLKSRGCYDTPGLTILRKLHQNLEGLVMDSKDDCAQCIYNGMYFTSERKFVRQSISISQKQVDGKVEALAYKGNVIIVGRSSETSNLYSEEESSMYTLEMDWSVEDTTGFINVNAIRIAKYGEPLSKPLQKLLADSSVSLFYQTERTYGGGGNEGVALSLGLVFKLRYNQFNREVAAPTKRDRRKELTAAVLQGCLGSPGLAFMLVHPGQG
ncbi:uncharacterized protein F5Z01DRAFT_633741 [Emericellopsis atlantica]|uniref:argininosuccinate synthase n=1 Tax=Emericellopsis atlantica TaxID=2614577 RepID=A0A9P7ZSR1_9HYPO|nr:uncharacterized protein F5Z01DRAFT_633741 [Emericellopsis atlantica]KAG9256968.1 hypothetical protein F5Z01DRAFT_633741 [Emericellopsis atlantica]